MLIDQCRIFVRSGKGGDGCVSLRREKYVPKGGPDGGDGGKGGDVIMIGDASVTTLLSLTPRPHYRAHKGQQGMGKSMHGADGESRIIKVPLGTIVRDQETGEVVVEIDQDGQRCIVAQGGKGGFGNEHFKSATNQTPREATPGEPCIDRVLELELKLIADVGLIGLPNAGKSTMLRAVSRATPKVADYPFTTLNPQLGIAELPGERRLIIADIPGLIEGAAGGAGLGHDFLRHIERTKVLVHVLEVMPIDDSDPASNHRAIRGELAGYSDALASKREIIVINKIDTIPEDMRDEMIGEIIANLGVSKDDIFCTSGVSGEGVPALLEECWKALDPEVESWSERREG